MNIEFSTKSSLVLMPAAVCSLAGWSLQYYSLTLTSPSSYSILRGTVIFFTGINSSLFLKHQMSWKKWGSLLIIFSGLVIVGMADILQPANLRKPEQISSTQVPTSEALNCSHIIGFRDVNKFLSNEVIGDILVVSAQIFLSAKFVYEEKVLSCYNIKPLQVIGWEGFYGLIGMAILLLPLSLVDTGSCAWSNSPTPPWTVEDVMDGFTQIKNNEILQGLMCFYLLVDAIYLYSAISVTNEFSATTSSVLESSRALLVWAVSLCIGWQHFQYLQLIGFLILTSGLFLYTW